MLTFIHTSDWQLGATFGQVPGDRGSDLRTHRLRVIDRIAAAAKDAAADFVLIAGDMFDAHAIDNTVVAQACERLARFAMPVYIIPGNHDFADTAESVYRRQRFIQLKPDHVHIIDTTDPIEVAAGRAVILPCPLLQRHTVTDPTGHLTADFGQPTEATHDATPIRIALAHGSVRDFAAEDGGTQPNLIDPNIVTRANLDYLALGDWHGRQRIGDRAWYAGTPEPDRFKDTTMGSVLKVTIANHSQIPDVEPIHVGACRWMIHEAHLHSADDLTQLDQWFSQIDQAEHTLVRLSLDGSLPLSLADRLQSMLNTQGDRLLHLRIAKNVVGSQPTDDELAALLGPTLVGQTAEQLIERAAASSMTTDDDAADDPATSQPAAVASLALQMLYQRAIGHAAEGN